MDNESQKQLEQFGNEIGVMLLHLDLPSEFIAAIAAIVPDLNQSQLEQLHASLVENTKESIEMEASPEYQKQSDEIDLKTIQEIESIISK